MKKSNLKFSAAATLPAGFRAAGIVAGLKKSRKPDMALFFSDVPAVLAGTFTTNQVKAATVRLDAERVAKIGVAHGIVVNSGQANACTGKQGLRDAQAMAVHAAQQFGVAPETFLVCSTGRIGVPLRMDVILPGIEKLAAAVVPNGGESAARGIMTTDLVPKRYTATFRANGRTCRFTGIAKGSGMIQPCMATMLAFLLTDAKVDRRAMQKALKAAVDKSFNRISVDADQSTNDTVLLLASGASGVTPDPTALGAAVHAACASLARQLIADAEGATKDIRIDVVNADTETDAVTAARAVSRSNLLKCAIHGEDPNWGRILSAVGTTDATFEPDAVDVAINGVTICRAGAGFGDRNDVDLSGREVTITVDLHAGEATATVWTNDLTAMYVHENSAYST